MAVPVLAAAGALMAVLRPAGPPVLPLADATPPRPVHATLTGSWYLGVRAPSAPRSWTGVAGFAARTATRPNIVVTYNGWRQPFPVAAARRARQHGAVLLVQMEPWGANLADLAHGGYSGYLRSFAAAVRRFGHPVIISFGHEMNGTWYPWGFGHVPPATFAAAWRDVVTEFRAEGADNVTWLWVIHHTRNVRFIRAYWPGDRYVNWVGLDGYFMFPHDSFASIFGAAARSVRRVTSKPIMIAETSVGPGARLVPAKIHDLFAGARREGFVGLVWFDVTQHKPPYHQNWRLENRPAALAAFRRAASLRAGSRPGRTLTPRGGSSPSR
jgi:hypothetical protein